MRTRLSESELSRIQTRHTRIPADYLNYLRNFGWGETDSGKMIYSGPIEPEFVYGAGVVESQVVLLGDDMQGYCFGFDLASQTYGEMTPKGDWEPWQQDQGFGHYVSA